MNYIFDKSLSQRQPIATSILEAAAVKEQLANAYLLTGRNIADKWLCAQQLAAYLNCLLRTDAQYCFSPDRQVNNFSELCQNCRWINDNNHPQVFLELTGQATKTHKIPVEKARLLSEELSKTSQFVRFVIIPDASQEIFHQASANALLKTMEEPGPACIFFLFANQEETVLSTILSRCQIIPIFNNQKAVNLLDPHLAAEIQNMPALSKLSLAEALDLSSRWLEMIEQGLEPQLLIDNLIAIEVARHNENALDNAVTSFYLKDLLELSESCKRQIEHFVSPKFVLESLAISWQNTGSKLHIESAT